MEWTFGAYGGDGTEIISNFDLTLGRQLYKSLSIYGKYSIGQRTINETDLISRLGADQLELYGNSTLNRLNIGLGVHVGFRY